MRKVEGFVCTAQDAGVPNSLFLFGPAVHLDEVEPGSVYENFLTNGLVPFARKRPLYLAFRQLGRRDDLTDFGIGSVRMEMMTSLSWQGIEKELEALRDAKKRVILLHTPEEVEIFGAQQDDKPQHGHLGTPFLTGGMVPIPDDRDIKEIWMRALDINRQAKSRTSVATFDFQKLDPKEFFAV